MKDYTFQWLGAVADLLINLSAGWFGAVVIVPNFSGIDSLGQILLLTADVVLGTVALLSAVYLRQVIHEP